MLKYLSVFCALLLFASNSMAGERVDRHDRYFPTGGRKIVIATAKEQSQYNEELSNFFTSCGAQVETGFFARLIYPSVSITRSAIDGREGEGFSIHVNRSSIKIRYSSPPYATQAIVYLKTLYSEPYAQRMILGVNVSVGQGTIDTGASTLSVDGGVVDCSSKFHNINSIQAALKRQAATGNRNMIILLASPAAFRLNLECFNLFNPSNPIVAKNEAYNSKMIAEINQYASQNNIKVTLGVDLLSDNENFEHWSAHKLSSVEGMRIVRSMIEELSQKWNVRRLYIGSSTSATASDIRYRKFLTKMATDNKMEFVIL